jgi:hypothetical protein
MRLAALSNRDQQLSDMIRQVDSQLNSGERGHVSPAGSRCMCGGLASGLSTGAREKHGWQWKCKCTHGGVGC